MSFAPHRDYTCYETIASKYDRAPYVRSDEERFNLYADYYNTVAGARAGPVVLGSMDDQRWKEKLAIRRKLVVAFCMLDRDVA